MESIPEDTPANLPSPKVNLSPSIKCLENVNNTAILTQGFDTSSTCFNSGRESLGIGKVFILNNHRDSFEWGRESLSNGRESLGILNMSELGRESIMGRASIGLLPAINISDCGKESLGILNLKNLEDDLFTEQSNTLSLTELTIETSGSKQPVMDTAFLLPEERRLSIFSSISSLNSNPSFNFNICDTLNISQIYSATPSETNSEFNEAFKQEFKHRIHSLPVNLEKNEEIIEVDVNKEKRFLEKQFFSCERVKKTRRLGTSFHGTLNFDEDEDQNDSVFAEATRLSQKFADGSIYNTNSSEEDWNLDSTAPPEWPNIDEVEEPPVEKFDTETVFKIIDRIIPPAVANTETQSPSLKASEECNPDPVLEQINSKTENIETQEDNTRNSCSSHESDKQHEHSDPIKAEISINSNHSAQLSRSRRSNSSMKSKEAKDIIHNLSQILSNDNLSDSTKEKGHNLLNNLAEMISDTNSFEDSENIFNSPKKMTPAKGKENRPNLSQNKSSNSCSSICSNDGSKILKNISLNIVKSKQPEKAKKGPMKATIPITQMAKKPTFTTPTKSMQKLSSNIQNRKTSTPIQNSKLKPMAQSTPADKIGNSRLPTMISSPMKRDTIVSSPMKKASPISSPLKRDIVVSSSKITRNNNSASSKLSSTDHPFRKLERAGSVSEIKRVAGDFKLKRSHSVGKTSGLLSAFSQVRQNIVSRLTENNNSIKLSNV